MELRRAGITDTNVLSAIERVPREEFVPAAFLDRAYDNVALPIEEGQTLSQPYVVAWMSEALSVGPRDKILEVGTGSGYHAAVLSRLCRRVYTLERHRSLLDVAEARFKALRAHNITTMLGDGWRGWPEDVSFERIIVTAAAESVPQRLADQLAPGGMMVLPIGPQGQEQRLVRVRREQGGFATEDLGRVRFVPLVADPQWKEARGRR